MRPELERLSERFREVRRTLSALDDVMRPASNGWTVAQVLDHLVKIHEAMQPRLEAALASAPPRTGDDPIPYSLSERMAVRVMSGRGIKLPVPKIFEPGAAGPEAKAACLATIDALLETLQRADEKALAGVQVSSPVSDRLRLGFLPYVDALIGHAQYHARQCNIDR